METMVAAVLLLAVFVVAGYYTLVPLLSTSTLAPVAITDVKTRALELRKINLMQQLRETEFEREMGLTDLEDFERTRQDLLGEMAEIIDALGQMDGAKAGEVSQSEQPGCPQCGSTLEEGAKFCSQCGSELGQKCSACQQPVSSGDKFCSHCGRGLLD